MRLRVGDTPFTLATNFGLPPTIAEVTIGLPVGSSTRFEAYWENAAQPQLCWNDFGGF